MAVSRIERGKSAATSVGAQNIVLGTIGDDALVGTSGDDAIAGLMGNDLIKGRAGADLIHGDAADEPLLGANDTMKGGDGNDTIWGGQGADVLRGGRGTDEMRGGFGDDLFMVKDSDDAGQDGRSLIIEELDQGYDAVYAAVNFTLGRNFEELRLFGGAQSGSGNQFNNHLVGSIGDNILRGLAGGDLIEGRNGHDVAHGGANRDTVRGGRGRDNLFGEGGRDVLDGAERADMLKGGLGNDQMDGGTGRDTLLGGDGKDRLSGGAGKDVAVGGAGADTFLFDDGNVVAGRANPDRVADFDRGENDTIDLSAIDANSTNGRDQSFLFVGTDAFSGKARELRYEVVSGDSRIAGDVDGDGAADFYILVEGVTALVSADFVL